MRQSRKQIPLVHELVSVAYLAGADVQLWSYGLAGAIQRQHTSRHLHNKHVEELDTQQQQQLHAWLLYAAKCCTSITDSVNITTQRQTTSHVLPTAHDAAQSNMLDQQQQSADDQHTHHLHRRLTSAGHQHHWLGMTPLATICQPRGHGSNYRQQHIFGQRCSQALPNQQCYQQHCHYSQKQKHTVHTATSHPTEQPTTFRQLGVHAAFLPALQSQHIHLPAPAQQASIPVILQGRNIAIQSATGTGKVT